MFHLYLITYAVMPEIKTPKRYGEHGMTLIDNILPTNSQEVVFLMI